MWNDLAAEIHADNIAAGWWKLERHWNAELGDEVVTTEPRNIGELLCLVHSEISEAVEGWSEGNADDKLPHRPMLDVELADASIRILDILGYQRWNIEECLSKVNLPPINMGQPEMFFVTVHCAISNAMEGYRKSNEPVGNTFLSLALLMIAQFAILNTIPLMDCIAEKRAFNKTRADHQLAARAAADGKKF